MTYLFCMFCMLLYQVPVIDPQHLRFLATLRKLLFEIHYHLCDPLNLVLYFLPKNVSEKCTYHG